MLTWLKTGWKKDMLTWPWRKMRSGMDPKWKGTPETSPNAREEKVPHQVSSVQRTHIRVFIHCWMLCDPLGSWTSCKKCITTWWVMSNNGWQRHSAAALRVCASLPAEQESLLRVQWVKIWILKVDWEFLRPAEPRPWAELQQAFGVVASCSTVWCKVELVFIRHVRPCAQHSTAISCAMHMDKDCYWSHLTAIELKLELLHDFSKISQVRSGRYWICGCLALCLGSQALLFMVSVK